MSWSHSWSNCRATTAEAAESLKHCDDRIKGRTWADIDRDRPMRHAIEIRHESFATDSFMRLLRKHHVALVTADTAGKWPMLHDVTADFVYVRLHGAEQLYASGYTDAALDDWAAKIRAWSSAGDAPAGTRSARRQPKRAKRDVYVYFDNDVKVRSPFDAARLAVKLGLREQPLEEGRTGRYQGSSARNGPVSDARGRSDAHNAVFPLEPALRASPDGSRCIPQAREDCQADNRGCVALIRDLD